MNNPTQNKTPFTFRQEAQKLTIYLYDDIEADDKDWWTGERIPSETSSMTISQMIESNPDVAEIELHINSNGGDVKEAMAIYSLLKRHKAHKTAYIDGFAASAASVIPMACDNIVMSVVSVMFIHHAWKITWGNPEQLRKEADDLEKIDSQSNRAYKEKAGDKLSQEKLDAMLDAETWLTADECLEYGLCDEVETIKKDEKKTVAQQMFNAFKQKQVNAKTAEQKTVIKQMADMFRNK